MSTANNYKRHGSRYKARRRAVDILFEAEFRDVDPVGIVEERQDLAQDSANQVKPVPAYTAQIVTGVAENLDAIDDAIALHLSSEWSLGRLPAVERAVLRVAVWELSLNEDVPNRVAIVEAVEIASEYCHDKAAGYINSVLDGVRRDADTQLAEAAAERRTEEFEQAYADDHPRTFSDASSTARNEQEGLLGGALDVDEQGLPSAEDQATAEAEPQPSATEEEPSRAAEAKTEQKLPTTAEQQETEPTYGQAHPSESAQDPQPHHDAGQQTTSVEPEDEAGTADQKDSAALAETTAETTE